MSAKRKVGVLISGRGSNLKSLIEACRDPNYPAEIVLVISNVAGAGGLAHAANANIATLSGQNIELVKSLNFMTTTRTIQMTITMPQAT